VVNEILPLREPLDPDSWKAVAYYWHGVAVGETQLYSTLVATLMTIHTEESVPENGFTQGWGMTWCGCCHEPWPCRTIKATGVTK